MMNFVVFQIRLFVILMEYFNGCFFDLCALDGEFYC